MLHKNVIIHSLKLKQKDKDNTAKRDKKLLNTLKKNPVLLESLRNTHCNKHGRRYTASRPFATRQMLSSSSAYRTLRAQGHLTLPHPKSVARWHRHISNLPGFNREILKTLQAAAKAMSRQEKVVAILIDGMAIKPFIDYHAMSDRIYGFTDDGIPKEDEQNSTERLATEAVVIMIRGLHSKFKQVIGYFLAHATLGSTRQKEILIEAVELLQNVGLYPVLAIMDQHPTNVKMVKELGISIKHPIFIVNNQEVVLMYDTPHIFKSLRNNWLVKNVYFNRKIASFKYLRDLHRLDMRRTPRLAPHLINKAIYPSTFDRMNVKLAVRTLSFTTSKAIETSISLGLMSADASPTAEFINMFDQLFDVFNSRFIIDKKKPNRSAITDNSDQWAILDEMQKVLHGMMFIPQDCFETRKFSDCIVDVLVYEWGIRIFMQLYNFPNRAKALAHIKLQEKAAIYND